MPIPGLTSGTAYVPTKRFSIDASGNGEIIGNFKIDGTVTPGIIYSAAGTALPSCTSDLNGAQATVSDATTPRTSQPTQAAVL